MLSKVMIVYYFYIWHDNDAFQANDSMILPDQFSCSVFPSGRVGAWVYFQRDSEGQVVSRLTVPGLTYGAVYYKCNTKELSRM